ncbi:MAG: NAD(P)H-hydrate dehydratase [Bacteroidetes bacterium]|nr:NAD(P)H-hydrate dehydratase [Bacteroidota bacterium]
MPGFKNIPASEAIRAWDRFSEEAEGIRSFQLMQRAAYGCFIYLKNHLDRTIPTAVCCGPGNNGGDGFLIAAYLNRAGFRILIFESGPGGSHDRQMARQFALDNACEMHPLSHLLHGNYRYIIDALFGHGLSRPLEKEYAEITKWISDSKLVYSIDMPSGMPSEPQAEVFSDFVKGADVLTFQCEKLCFFLDEYRKYINNVQVIDIGLSPHFPRNESGPYLLEEESVSTLYRIKQRVSHKGSFGSTLLIGGSSRYPGSILLAAEASLYTGVGKTFISTTHLPRTIGPSRNPEVIWLKESGMEVMEFTPDIHSYSAVGVGPGLGQDKRTQDALFQLFQKETKWILDADALNFLAIHPEVEPFGKVIITPHPGEFDRLTHPHQSTGERWKTAAELAIVKKWVVVLKGSFSAVFFPDGTRFINTSGNAGLAKGGSGDVLCGLISGYVGRGYSVEEAALIGVYLHGLSANELSKRKSLDSILASDLVHEIGRITKRWES